MKRIAAILILAATLTGCSWLGLGSDEKDSDKYAKCPDVLLLAPARGWIDPPGDAWQTRGEISEFAIECKITKTAAEITITPKVQMERHQTSADDVKFEFPVFVAVMRGDDILSKKIISEPVKFSADEKQAEPDWELPVSLEFIKVPDPVPDTTNTSDDKDKKDEDKKPKDTTTAADRKVMIGFQLTPEQQAYFEKLRDAPVPNITSSPAAK